MNLWIYLPLLWIYESIFYNIHFVELMEEVLSNVELQVRLHNLQLFHNHLIYLFIINLFLFIEPPDGAPPPVWPADET